MRTAANVSIKPARASAAWRRPLSLVAAAILAFSPTDVLAQSGSDSFGLATLLTGGSGSVIGSNEGATAEGGEPNHAQNPAEASLWWRWTAPSSGSAIFSTAGSGFDTVLAVYEGATLPGLIVVAENDDSGDGYQSAVTFQSVAGTTYWIAVDGYDGETGTVMLSWSHASNNDAFADAAEIGGASGIALGQTFDATEEAGEPDHAGEPGGASVWRQWTAPSDEEVAFDTFGGDFSTVLAVYTGDDLNSLIEVGSDVDYSPDSRSQVRFSATAGTVYRIAVDGIVWEPGLSPTSGIVVLWWGPPLPNDDFAAAVVIGGFSGSAAGANLGAALEPGEPEHRDFLGGASVWWQWTAPDDGVVTFDTFGSNFDTILAVYTGEAVDALTLVADNDDTGDGVQSLVSFAAASGTTYRIMVDGYEGETGNISLNWSWTSLSDEPLRIEGLAVLSDGSFRFVLRGPLHATGSVQRSSNCQDWEEWRPFDLGEGEMEFIDPDAGSVAAQYFRAVSQ